MLRFFVEENNMARLLKPHTEEWFIAMERVNPTQAKVTRMIVETAGTSEVCSLCGIPADSDFEKPDKTFLDGSPMTFRLCRFCAHQEKMISRELSLRGEIRPLAA